MNSQKMLTDTLLLHKQKNTLFAPNNRLNQPHEQPEILFITSFPPRECGIATYSQDMIASLSGKFGNSFKISVCALETDNERKIYEKPVKYTLNTDKQEEFDALRMHINQSAAIKMVLVQHEFGFFRHNEQAFLNLLDGVTKPIVIVFHTVLPCPDSALKEKVKQIAKAADSIIVMTNSSAEILRNDYHVSAHKVTIIPHGTHLVPHMDKEELKEKYRFTGRRILSTFGLLSAGKSIETTLNALPAIVKNDDSVLFLVIGKTHPSIVSNEGETYRNMLMDKVQELQLQKHVLFINYFLSLPELLEYLQLTDVYLFTSKDPHQAVSGTFSYALSCGCPIVSTPIPHAVEVLQDDAGVIIDFNSPNQLSEAVNRILNDDGLRRTIASNGLHRMAATAWENTAVAHALLFEQMAHGQIVLKYSVPDIRLDHVKKMTTSFGMIQFSQLNEPDILSGYTLDDNARAMIAMCNYYEVTSDTSCFSYLNTYLSFIKLCQQDNGHFLNYVDENGKFTDQNNDCNLDDANGRAIWALGYLVSLSKQLPPLLVAEADLIFQKAVWDMEQIHSSRAMALIIKGLYYYTSHTHVAEYENLIVLLANRLVQMYRHEASQGWEWFESYLTYANSLLPEAMLCAWLATGNSIYKNIAKKSFEFLLSKTYQDNSIKPISNAGWLAKGAPAPAVGGEQPIEVAYTILALEKFHAAFPHSGYLVTMHHCFDWFLGNNHLHHIIYNPCTGGCYDGLEEHSVNLNQGAESTLSYCISRLLIEKVTATTQPTRVASEVKMYL